MALETIEHPEVGGIYLVRKRVGGNAKVRFEPARILDVYRAKNFKYGKFIFNGELLKVEWLYDGEVQEDVVNYDGAVKFPARDWWAKENERIDHELEKAHIAKGVLHTYLVHLADH